MNTIYGLYAYFGKILFWLLLPIERIFIRPTTRVYGLIVKDNKVLMTKNWLSDGKWALPGGGAKKSELITDSLKRELEEELSIELGGHPLKKVAAGIWKSHRLGFKYEIYEIKDVSRFKINRRLEITDAAWIEILTLSKDNTSSDTLEILSQYF